MGWYKKKTTKKKNKKKKNSIIMERPLDAYQRLLETMLQYKTMDEERIAMLEPQLQEALKEEGRIDERNVIKIKEIRRKIRELDDALKHEKSLLDYHESEIQKFTRNIHEITVTDPKTIQSAAILKKATLYNRQNTSEKKNRMKPHPLDRLSAHGPYAHSRFLGIMGDFSGVDDAIKRQMPYRTGGRKKTLKRKTHH